MESDLDRQRSAVAHWSHWAEQLYQTLAAERGGPAPATADHLRTVISSRLQTVLRSSTTITSTSTTSSSSYLLQSQRGTPVSHEVALLQRRIQNLVFQKQYLSLVVRGYKRAYVSFSQQRSG